MAYMIDIHTFGNHAEKAWFETNQREYYENVVAATAQYNDAIREFREDYCGKIMSDCDPDSITTITLYEISYDMRDESKFYIENIVHSTVLQLGSVLKFVGLRQ